MCQGVIAAVFPYNQAPTPAALACIPPGSPQQIRSLNYWLSSFHWQCHQYRQSWQLSLCWVCCWMGLCAVATWGCVVAGTSPVMWTPRALKTWGEPRLVYVTWTSLEMEHIALVGLILTSNRKEMGVYCLYVTLNRTQNSIGEKTLVMYRTQYLCS